MHKTAHRLGLCAAIFVLPLAAQAQFNPQYYIDLSSSMLGTIQMETARRMLVNATVNETFNNSRSAAANASSKQATTFKPAVPNKEPGIDKLAGAYPASSRAQVQQTLHELLAGYHQIEQKFDVQRNDVSGAIAAFIVGNYMATAMSTCPTSTSSHWSSRCTTCSPSSPVSPRPPMRRSRSSTSRWRRWGC